MRRFTYVFLRSIVLFARTFFDNKKPPCNECESAFSAFSIAWKQKLCTRQKFLIFYLSNNLKEAKTLCKQNHGNLYKKSNVELLAKLNLSHRSYLHNPPVLGLKQFCHNFGIIKMTNLFQKRLYETSNFIHNLNNINIEIVKLLKIRFFQELKNSLMGSMSKIDKLYCEFQYFVTISIA